MNPQYEAHERMCKSIGDMANENTRLQERIKQLEDAMGIANTLLQLVMCEQNHLREVRNKANDRIKRLEEAGDVLAQRSAQLGLLPMAIEGWNKAKEVKP